MEGETYSSICAANETRGSPSLALRFIRGQNTTEGYFAPELVKKMTRTKYLIRDATGSGVLDVSGIDMTVIRQVIGSIKKESKRIGVIGRLRSPGCATGTPGCATGTEEDPEPTSIPTVIATSISPFSYFSALCFLLDT